jgi:hypothetical protein
MTLHVAKTRIAPPESHGKSHEIVLTKNGRFLHNELGVNAQLRSESRPVLLEKF